MLDLTCKALECDNLADRQGWCELHLRRFISGNVILTEDGDWVDTCTKGHPMIGANVRWESSGKRGKKRRRCRTCLREKAQRQARERIIEVEIPKPYRPNDLTLTTAIADFEEALNHVTAKCKANPGPYMDWDEEDGNVPSEADAAALCAGCPLLQACGNYAVAARMTDGIWGGRRFIKGVQL